MRLRATSINIFGQSAEVADLASIVYGITNSGSAFNLRSSGTVNYTIDWGDGSDLEFVQNPKLFDRLESLEHTYEMPGFYTIKGLVYKKALQMVNIYPPVEEDSSIHYDPIVLFDLTLSLLLFYSLIRQLH